jgi:serine phosphatase RsbU (regulator of sigma subunit)/tetratricopeptide (TPR) repeat protein
MPFMFKYISIFFLLSYAYLQSQNNSLDSLLKSIKLNKQADTGKVNALNKIAQSYNKVGEYDKAITYANLSSELSEKLNFRSGLYKSHIQNGLANLNLGKLKIALDYFQSSLKVCQSSRDTLGIAKSYVYIGNLYYGQEENQLALNNYQFAIKYFTAIKDYSNQGLVYSNIGAVYDNLGVPDKAIESYFSSIFIYKATHNYRNISNTYNNIAELYNSQKKYEKAIDNYKIALTFAEEYQNESAVGIIYTNLSDVYFKMKNFEASKKMGLLGLRINKEMLGKSEIMNAYWLLAQCDSALGNWKDAYTFKLQYLNFNLSILNDNKSIEIKELAVKYETAKKEQQLLQLKKEQEKERALANSESNRQQVFMWLISVLTIAIAVVAFTVWQSLKMSRKRNSVIEAQNTEVENAKQSVERKNRSMVDSIEYAKRIQDAKLPNLTYIYETLSDSFILFKPKDIVSGDFYYFFKKDEHAIFIAAIDCTGHGIPGAFMTMIASEKLYEAVRYSSDTSEILQLVNLGIKKALKQSDDFESSKDGMDIALCKLDIVNNTIEFAGANRPIWIVRKGQNDIEEVRGNKNSIGGFTSDDLKFDSHKIQLQKGDTFYLFTDGYADTFAKNQRLKLTTRKMKEVVLSINHLPMREQSNYLDEYIENWKNGEEQTDDILVMGFRL